MLWRVLIASVVLVCSAVIVLAVLVPRIGGAEPFTVLTGSMKPTLPPGTLVVVKPIDPDLLRVGDVATYQLKSGEPTVVTHRIVSVSQGQSSDNGRTFGFKGDANSVTDPDPVIADQIRGRLWYSVPYLGYLSHALTGAQRQSAVSVVAGLLLIYAVWMAAGAARERRRERERVSS